MKQEHMAGSKKNTVKYGNFIEYVNFEDVVNYSQPSILTLGTQNCIIKARRSPKFVSELWKRRGYKKLETTFCTKKTEENFKYNNLSGHFKWDTKYDQEIFVRHYGNNMIVSDNLIDWIQINTTDFTLTEAEWNYTSWWDDDIKQQVLLFVNGEEINTVNRWDGYLTRVSSVVDNVVTLKDKRFPDTEEPGTIYIGCILYEYTSIKGNEVFLSSFPSSDLTNALVASPINTGKLYGHKIRTGKDFKPHTILTYKNHVFYADKNQNVVFASKSIGGDDYINLDWTVPIPVTDGYTFICDNLVVGMFNVRDGVLVGCKNNEWHYITDKKYNYGVTDALNPAGVEIYHLWIEQKMTSGDQQGLKHQWLGRINQTDLVFVSEEPSLSYVNWGSEILNESQNSFDSGDAADSRNYGKLGRGNIVNLSRRVEREFDYIESNKLWNKATKTYYKKWILMAVPEMGRTYIYDFELGATDLGGWQPPQTLPMGAYVEKDGKLYGYSFTDSSVYEMFSGFTDDGTSIKTHVVGYFDDMNYPFSKKHEDRFFILGRASEGTKFKIKSYYDFGTNGETGELFVSARPQYKWDFMEGGQSVPNTDENKYFYDKHSDKMDSNRYLLLLSGWTKMDKIGNSFYRRQFQIFEDESDTEWMIIAFGSNATLTGESDISSEMFGEEVGYDNSKDYINDPNEC